MAGEQARRLIPWVEFHDSTVLSLIPIASDVEICLDAYVHRWEKRRDAWFGTGWSQPIWVLIKNVINRTVTLNAPVNTRDGHLTIGTNKHENGVELPYKSSEPVSLRLELVCGHDFEIAGRGILVEATGEPRFIEDLLPDLRPQNAD